MIIDIDRKELTFLGSNRPACQYLYFHYLTTYLHRQRLVDVEWRKVNIMTSSP
jgi:hypothetical protein